MDAVRIEKKVYFQLVSTFSIYLLNVFVQLSNQAQASVDGDNSLPPTLAESSWAMRDHGRHHGISSTPPPQPPIPEVFISTETRARSPNLAEPRAMTPSSSFYANGMRSSTPPMNPWNPYLRSYGRIYEPYNLSLNQYDTTPSNWMVSNETSQRSMPNYQLSSHVHMMPSFRFDTYSTMRRALSRPRSNRSFLQYSVAERETTEPNLFVSSVPVIEISSDEEEAARAIPLELSRQTSAISSIHSTGDDSSSENRSRIEPTTALPEQRTLTESKPIKPLYFRRRSSSEESTSSTGDYNRHHHHNNEHNYQLPHPHPHPHPHPRYYVPQRRHSESPALNLSSGMKRSHPHSPPHQPIKRSRSPGPSILSRPMNYFARDTPIAELNESHSSDDEPEERNTKPNVSLIDADIKPSVRAITPSPSTSNNNADDDNNIEHKIKIRIKREFKTEATNTECVENNVESKEHLRPLIAEFKQE